MRVSSTNSSTLTVTSTVCGCPPYGSAWSSPLTTTPTGCGFPGFSPRPWLRPGAGVLDRILDQLLDADGDFNGVQVSSLRLGMVLDADGDFNGVQVSSLWLGIFPYADHDSDRLRVSSTSSSTLTVTSTVCRCPPYGSAWISTLTTTPTGYGFPGCCPRP